MPYTTWGSPRAYNSRELFETCKPLWTAFKLNYNLLKPANGGWGPPRVQDKQTESTTDQQNQEQSSQIATFNQEMKDLVEEFQNDVFKVEIQAQEGDSQSYQVQPESDTTASGSTIIISSDQESEVHWDIHNSETEEEYFYYCQECDQEGVLELFCDWCWCCPQCCYC